MLFDRMDQVLLSLTALQSLLSQCKLMGKKRFGNPMHHVTAVITWFGYYLRLPLKPGTVPGNF